jgi:nucleotide-binding universal stress UspA family protein
MYDRILVPTDGSEGSAVALDHAIDLARGYGASIHGLYVTDRRSYAGMAGDMDREVIREEEEMGQRALDRIEAAATGAGTEVTTALAVGIPHERIVEAITERDVDLVVMSTHGRTGLERMLLGSTTEKVLRLSPVAVHAVPAPDPDPGSD